MGQDVLHTIPPARAGDRADARVRRNSALFHSVYRIRRAIGLSLNLEMMLLVRELFAAAGTQITVTIGTPHLPSPGDTLRHDARQAERLRHQVEQLPTQINGSRPQPVDRNLQSTVT